MSSTVRLDGRVVVVTGAGRGLGRAYAESLAQRGARVVVNGLGTQVDGSGHDSSVAREVADGIRAAGGTAVSDDSDIAAVEGGRRLVECALDSFGRIDALVNNAGICGSQLFEDATLEDFERYWRVHVGGSVNTSKAAWPHMAKQNAGRIIMTTSGGGLYGLRGQATYAAAKCAVIGLMRVLAIEGHQHGILVNTIAPGGFSRMHAAAISDKAWLARAELEQPAELVAPAITWLVSDECQETSQIYAVGGGSVKRIAIIEGPGFHDPELTAEDIAANYGSVHSLDGFREPTSAVANAIVTADSARAGGRAAPQS